MQKITKKLLIYPFGEQASPIIRHISMLSDYEIMAVVSPAGWGLTGNDAGLADNGGSLGIFVSDDYEEAISVCDTALFVDSNKAFDFKKYVFPKICRAIENNINIIVTANIESNIEDSIREMCKEKGVSFDYYGLRNSKPYECNIIRENLLNIKVPVIFILGVAENMDKFEIQLSIRDEFLKTRYKISQVGTRSYSSLFGIHDFPQFMFDEKISEVKKILMFNRYIWDIEIKEKPEVIIVGIPGGIIPFSNYFTNRFGILAVEASMAVKPDAAVLSVPFGDYEKDNYIKFTNIVKHRLGFDVDAVVLSNVMPEWSVIRQGIEMSYVRVESDFVNTKKITNSNFDIPVFNIFNKDDAHKLSDCLIQKLEEYGEIGVI